MELSTIDGNIDRPQIYTAPVLLVGLGWFYLLQRYKRSGVDAMNLTLHLLPCSICAKV